MSSANGSFVSDLVSSILGPPDNSGGSAARTQQTATLISALLSSFEQLNHVGTARLDQIDAQLGRIQAQLDRLHASTERIENEQRAQRLLAEQAVQTLVTQSGHMDTVAGYCTDRIKRDDVLRLAMALSGDNIERSLVERMHALVVQGGAVGPQSRPADDSATAGSVGTEPNPRRRSSAR